MPWRDLLSPAQRAQVMALPTSLREYEELYTLTPADQEFVTVHRTNANRLGVAVQLCFLRHPGRAWAPEETMPVAMLRFIAQQVGAEPVDLLGYAERDQTRREHAIEMMREYGFTTFGVRDYRTLSSWLTEQARGTDNGLALVTLLISEVRRRRIVVPTLPVVERLALACRARARREAYAALSADLTLEQRSKLEGLLDARGETRQTYLGWVRQSFGAANPTNVLSCLERLTFLRSLGIPVTWSARLPPEPACADRPRRGQHGRDAPQSVQPGSAVRDACRGGSRCDDSVDRRGAGDARAVSGTAVQEGGAKTPWQVSGERQSNQRHVEALRFARTGVDRGKVSECRSVRCSGSRPPHGMS